VIEVEERSLGALEQHVLASRKGRLDEPGRVVQMVRETLAPGGGQLDERFDLEGLAAHRREQQVLIRQQPPQAGAEHLPVEQVLHAEPDAPGAVAVCRPDPPPRGPDLRAVEPNLVRPIQGHVVRHDHVRAPAHADAPHVDASRDEHVQLADERLRVDDDAAADHRRDVWVQHTRRHQVELEDLVALDDGVPGVVPALVTHDHRHLLGKEVGRLALALVAPLQSNDDRGGHQRALAGLARRIEKARAWWPGTWLQISRGSPPELRRLVCRSLGRLTGRTTRPDRAIAGPPLSEPPRRDPGTPRSIAAGIPGMPAAGHGMAGMRRFPYCPRPPPARIPRLGSA
jgi:hypothetical protein